MKRVGEPLTSIGRISFKALRKAADSRDTIDREYRRWFGENSKRIADDFPLDNITSKTERCVGGTKMAENIRLKTRTKRKIW